MKNRQPITIEEPIQEGKEPSQSPMKLFLIMFVAPIVLIALLMGVMSFVN